MKTTKTSQLPALKLFEGDTKTANKPRRKPTRKVTRCSSLRVADADTRTIAEAHSQPDFRASFAQVVLTAVEHVGTDREQVEAFIHQYYPRHAEKVKSPIFATALSIARKKDAARNAGKGNTVILPTNAELAKLASTEKLGVESGWGRVVLTRGDVRFTISGKELNEALPLLRRLAKGSLVN